MQPILQIQKGAMHEIIIKSSVNQGYFKITFTLHGTQATEVSIDEEKKS